MTLQQLLFQNALPAALAALLLHSPAAFAASHREAPITALDQKADITDWYAFVSPEHPDRVVLILNVDPFLEPSNGPNYFPFDPGILYEMKIDNNRDGLPDVTFQFRFKTQIANPGVFTGYVGGLAGIPAITSLSGPGSEGLNLIQTYEVTMITPTQHVLLNNGQTLYAVPTNVGPRTMPNYTALRQQGVYTLLDGIRVFAGTVADPFFVDLGAAFDSLNFRASAGGGVLSAAVDADDLHNYAPNALAGFNVNTMMLEMPITMLTADGSMHAATDKNAVIGTWGTTSRRKQSVLRDAGTPGYTEGAWAQVQRLGNPLINELIIGTGSKDRFSMDEPANDVQFSNFFLNPLLATIFSSIGIPVPPGPRTDLLPLVEYMAPICPGCAASDAGPIADLLRLNVGIAPTPFGSQKRLGFLAGDNGFPNGRRPVDDVIDIAARAVAGILVDSKKYGTAIGDGVNTSSAQLLPQFPFLAPAYSGKDSAHAGPGQTGCPNQPGGICPIN
ncbi:MAG TPA: DUF4331 domain-containing protein [Bryobacteraceae bacterium]|nr:DUF4331 domain-containing protein [Bryobacteraceae bacterium]